VLPANHPQIGERGLRGEGCVACFVLEWEVIGFV
jgi:hypothetical protein